MRTRNIVVAGLLLAGCYVAGCADQTDQDLSRTTLSIEGTGRVMIEKGGQA